MINTFAEANNDYRQFKQPAELKNYKELQLMTEQEKHMYAEKLRTEIGEYKHREAVYAAKRNELVEIETAYRLVQTKNVGRLDAHKGKKETQVQVATCLHEQVQDFQRKRAQQAGATADARDKIRNIEEVVQRRQAEMDELRRVIQNKSALGSRKGQEIESKKSEQQQMIRDFEAEKERLFAARELKEAQEKRIEDQQEKIREKKNRVFDLTQKHTDLKNQHQTHASSIRDLEQEIARVDTEITRRNSELQSLQRTKDELEGQIQNKAQDIMRAKEQKMLEEEQVRRTTNDNQLAKQHINSVREAIEEVMQTNESLQRCNALKRSENEELVKELEALNKHIVLLADQNQELEHELDRFLASDNEIRAKLMDRERSPLRMSDLYAGGARTAELQEAVGAQENNRPSGFQVQAAQSQSMHQRASEQQNEYGQQNIQQNQLQATLQHYDSAIGSVGSNTELLALRKCPTGSSQYNNSQPSGQKGESRQFEDRRGSPYRAAYLANGPELASAAPQERRVQFADSPQEYQLTTEPYQATEPCQESGYKQKLAFNPAHTRTTQASSGKYAQEDMMQSQPQRTAAYQQLRERSKENYRAQPEQDTGAGMGQQRHWDEEDFRNQMAQSQELIKRAQRQKVDIEQATLQHQQFESSYDRVEQARQGRYAYAESQQQQVTHHSRERPAAQDQSSAYPDRRRQAGGGGYYIPLRDPSPGVVNPEQQDQEPRPRAHSKTTPQQPNFQRQTQQTASRLVPRAPDESSATLKASGDGESNSALPWRSTFANSNNNRSSLQPRVLPPNNQAFEKSGSAQGSFLSEALTMKQTSHYRPRGSPLRERSNEYNDRRRY